MIVQSKFCTGLDSAIDTIPLQDDGTDKLPDR